MADLVIRDTAAAVDGGQVVQILLLKVGEQKEEYRGRGYSLRPLALPPGRWLLVSWYMCVASPICLRLFSHWARSGGLAHLLHGR